MPMLVGLLVGIAIGLVLGPLLRSWIAWREYVDASKEAPLHEDLLLRMSEQSPGGEEAAEDPVRPAEMR
jgi:hypothetical protein